jgi:hypothetical protein
VSGESSQEQHLGETPNAILCTTSLLVFFLFIIFPSAFPNAIVCTTSLLGIEYQIKSRRLAFGGCIGLAIFT